MYNLLIVDDEPIIADSLAHMIEETQADRFAVYVAYSGKKAAEMFESIRIDLLVTDICMPDIDGLKLRDIVAENWPQCRIIFLTGHNEFEYTRKAINPTTVSYILKTEGDEAVIEALNKACDRLELEYQEISKKISRIKIAEPLLKAEILKALTFPTEVTNIQSVFDMIATLNDPIDIKKPMLVSVGAFDIHLDAIEVGKIQNIVEKTLEVRYKTMCSVLPGNTFVMLIQDRGEKPNIAHCKGLLEVALGMCANVVNSCKLSFFLEDDTWDINELPSVYNDLLQKRLQMKGNPGVQVVKTQPDKIKTESKIPVIEAFQLQNIMNCLSTGQMEQYYTTINELTAKFRQSNKIAKLTVYTTLASLLMNSISHHLPFESSLYDDDITYRLGNYYTHHNFGEAMKYLDEIAKEYFEQIDEMGENNANIAVKQVNSYISDNLSGDLSLTKLADCVGLHPSYLSRLYKETSGVSLSSYIVNIRIAASRDMLENTKMKTNEIAHAIGFNTASYFTNFFKKNTGITPQEYRHTLKK